MTIEKREKKYSEKKLENFSIFPAIRVFFHLESAGAAWTFIGAILRDFFFLQMAQALHITKRPVIYVDTELDEKIPFTPSYVKTYMSFVPYFIKPMSYIVKRLGIKKAAPYLKLFLGYLTLLYKSASSIYRFSMTTTHRPRYFKKLKFITIHLFDPHLLCVPSLHVAIASGTYAWFRQFFKTGIIPQKEAESHLEEIKKQAIAIIESVLLVKQHSVNCIPTALYMITSTMNKSFFTPEDATLFINSFFNTTPEISPETRKELQDYFAYMYERIYTEKYYNSNWQDSIKHWLLEYAEKTGQKINV